MLLLLIGLWVSPLSAAPVETPLVLSFGEVGLLPRKVQHNYFSAIRTYAKSESSLKQLDLPADLLQNSEFFVMPENEEVWSRYRLKAALRCSGRRDRCKKLRQITDSFIKENKFLAK